MRILFVQLELPWPIRSGPRLHSYYVMQALSRLGHTVRLICPKSGDALPTLVERGWAFERLGRTSENGVSLNWITEKWLGYWGIDVWVPKAACRAVREFRPDAILGVGQNVLPVLAAIRERPVIWYAGDEPTILHLSLLKNYRTSNRIRSLQEAFYSLIYERTLLSRVSGVVVVSELDRFAMRWIAGARKVVTIPNGVDLEKFHTNDGKKRPYSVIFWGRMDYPPNVDAVLWFYEEVFLVLKRKYEQAEFVIVGADPHALVLDLGKKSGVRVLGEVEDIRPYVWSAACTVIPIRLGHGIKNKLLEASALGAAAVISPQCLNGLRVCKDDYPWLVAKSKDEWIRSVEHLWWDEDARIRLGRKARRWVEESHTWEAVAQSLQEFLKELSTSLQA